MTFNGPYQDIAKLVARKREASKDIEQLRALSKELRLLSDRALPLDPYLGERILYFAEYARNLASLKDEG